MENAVRRISRGGDHNTNHKVGITRQIKRWGSQYKSQGGDHKTNHKVGITIQITRWESQDENTKEYHQVGIQRNIKTSRDKRWEVRTKDEDERWEVRTKDEDERWEVRTKGGR